LFIQTEDTPNPNSLKFNPGRVVIDEGRVISFRRGDESINSSFAQRLFEIESVEEVMLALDFITITKHHDADWLTVKPQAIGLMVEYFINNIPFVSDEAPEALKFDESDPIIHEIREILDTRVRPAVAQDGGDIVFDSFEDGVVYLRLKGACSGCPSSSATLKSGIENMLKYYVPEVIEVRQVET
jgi:Fe-S cluster biogenesis protein NfuA